MGLWDHWIASFSYCLLAIRSWSAGIFLVARDAVAGAVYKLSVVDSDTAQANYVSGGELAGRAVHGKRAWITHHTETLPKSRQARTKVVDWTGYSISCSIARSTNLSCRAFGTTQRTGKGITKSVGWRRPTGASQTVS